MPEKTIKQMIKSTSEYILHCSITMITCSAKAPACLLFLCKIKLSCVGLALAPVCYTAKYLLYDRLSPFRYMKLSVSSLWGKHILLLVIAIIEQSPVKKNHQWIQGYKAALGVWPSCNLIMLLHTKTEVWGPDQQENNLQSHCCRIKPFPVLSPD